MARGKPRRGGAARGGRGGGRGGAAAGRASAPSRDRVAKPGCSELPTDLVVAPLSEPLPAIFGPSFPEFTNQQCFFSALESLCPEFSASADGIRRCWLGVPAATIKGVSRDPDDPSSFMANLELSGCAALQPVFVKRTHILDCMNAMQGEYIWPEEGALPAPSSLWKAALGKINDPLNEAYVDAVFAMVADRMVVSKKSPHWCRCFGTFAARVDKYLYNISEEYASIRNKPWWRRNQKQGLFKLATEEEGADDTSALISAAATEELSGDDFEAVGSTELALEKDDVSITEAEPELSSDESLNLKAPKLRLQRMKDSPSNSDGGSGYSDDTDSEEEEVFVEFKHFPVQVSLLERAEGTLDELLDDEDEEDEALLATKEARWSAWLFQVIAALSAAQHWFGFVHNDLHTNNIMWSATEQTHIYYRIHKGKQSWVMKVPTYGRILKIIDFGRASFHLPEPAGFFISDAFYPGNDASEQYNCEPFYDPEDGPKVEPNPSFDLCRLAVSLLEALYPDRPATATPTSIMSREGGKVYTSTVSPVYNLIWSWLIDDDGKNVLRLPNGDERYPSFDLYKAIAQNVHSAIPAKQIEKPIFAEFRTTELAADATVYELHI